MGSVVYNELLYLYHCINGFGTVKEVVEEQLEAIHDTVLFVGL